MYLKKQQVNTNIILYYTNIWYYYNLLIIRTEKDLSSSDIIKNNVDEIIFQLSAKMLKSSTLGLNVFSLSKIIFKWNTILLKEKSITLNEDDNLIQNIWRNLVIFLLVFSSLFSIKVQSENIFSMSRVFHRIKCWRKKTKCMKSYFQKYRIWRLRCSIFFNSTNVFGWKTYLIVFNKQIYEEIAKLFSE